MSGIFSAGPHSGHPSHGHQALPFGNVRGDAEGPRGLSYNPKVQEGNVVLLRRLNEMNSIMETERPTWGRGKKREKKGKQAFFSGDARSRGILPTWAPTIGENLADVLAAARARTAARAVPHWKLARRARSRGLPRPRPLPTNPLVQSLFAPSWPRPFPTRPSPIRPAAREKRVT